MLTPFNDIWKNKSEGCSVAFKAINQSLVIRKNSLLPYSHNSVRWTHWIGAQWFVCHHSNHSVILVYLTPFFHLPHRPQFSKVNSLTCVFIQTESLSHMGRRNINTCETRALDNLHDRIDVEGSREFFFITWRYGYLSTLHSSLQRTWNCLLNRV
jgi:hypothetical protein